MSRIGPVPAATASGFTPGFHGVRVDVAGADFVRRWGQAGGLSISQNAVKAARRLRVRINRAVTDEPAQDAAPVNLSSHAALSLRAQANIDRQGAIRLLLG